MISLRLTRAHLQLGLLDYLRAPTYLVVTALFPALFFTIFDLQIARTQAAIADYATLAFMVWAVAGVCLYQFGVGIASERGRPWERYLRTLPVSAATRFAARVLTALVFAAISAGAIAVLAKLATPIDLSALQWLRVFGYLLYGGVPFVLFGMAIGYWTSPRAAVPIATALNLLLAYAGGLWMPPQYLMHPVQIVSPYLPTRQLAELVWSVVTGHDPVRPALGLAIYAGIFGLLAVRGYRRDERARYA